MSRLIWWQDFEGCTKEVSRHRLQILSFFLGIPSGKHVAVSEVCLRRWCSLERGGLRPDAHEVIYDASQEMDRVCGSFVLGSLTSAMNLANHLAEFVTGDAVDLGLSSGQVGLSKTGSATLEVRYWVCLHLS